MHFLSCSGACQGCADQNYCSAWASRRGPRPQLRHHRRDRITSRQTACSAAPPAHRQLSELSGCIRQQTIDSARPAHFELEGWHWRSGCSRANTGDRARPAAPPSRPLRGFRAPPRIGLRCSGAGHRAVQDGWRGHVRRTGPGTSAFTPSSGARSGSLIDAGNIGPARQCEAIGDLIGAHGVFPGVFPAGLRRPPQFTFAMHAQDSVHEIARSPSTSPPAPRAAGCGLHRQ